MKTILKQNIVMLLIVAMVAINAGGLLSPVLNSNDAYFYAVISKTMVTQHNWIDLYYGGMDWLDKPHLPFWLTAISFKLFGINAFAYVLPGFIFNLIGAYYTYRLGKYLFDDHQTGLISALIYLSSLHLLLSSLDVRAEAFLLGEITPACYYWLVYDRKSTIKSLLLAGLFTGLALMTKGLFVVITIFSGLVLTWIYQRQYRKIISFKWLLGYVLSLLFALPEFICLYLQFDAHPEKLVFGQHNVSGLMWFFWGSQFGRFFNSGPIVNTHGNPFFFVHTFLWAFLPWSLIFIVSIYTSLRYFVAKSLSNKTSILYLHGAFWLTFIMFSATKFQLDHYTNIIMPFAAILCAQYLVSDCPKLNRIAHVQMGLVYLLLLLNIILIGFVFKLTLMSFLIIVPLALLIIVIYTRKIIPQLPKIFIWSPLAIGSVFTFLMLVNGVIYQRYDAGYNLANRITSLDHTLPIYSLDIGNSINNLEFHSNRKINVIEKIDNKLLPANYYLIAESGILDSSHVNNVQLIGTFADVPMTKFIPSLLNDKNYRNNVKYDNLYQINLTNK